MENEGAKGTIVLEFAAREYPRRQVLAPTNGDGDTKSRARAHTYTKLAPLSLTPALLLLAPSSIAFPWKVAPLDTR